MPPTFLLCPDSFKGSLSAVKVAEAMEAGIRSVYPESVIHKLPIADGGEGTVEAILRSINGSVIPVEVTAPLGNRVEASYGIIENGDIAVIEMAAAAGLGLVPVALRNPLKTTTYGVGELIRDAIIRGCRKLLIGVGGSATHDLGLGMAQALGVRFFDKNNELITNPISGEYLANIADIDINGLINIKDVEISVLADVQNSLLGKNGAAGIYAPQKGANPEMVQFLEKGTRRCIDIIEPKIGCEIRNIPGTGTAGGLAAGLISFLEANIVSGIDTVLDMVDFDKVAAESDYIITGEGKFDLQTLNGKAVSKVIEKAGCLDKKIIIIAGLVELQIQQKFSDENIKVISLSDLAGSVSESIRNPEKWIKKICRNLFDPGIND